ncbi:MAG TPA: heparan-alpha-glucosaminide N-acetyltransferase domain-containing protein [Cyclobacteriaceae bacterium]|nr:heparan-alpha-glucosaminide N-acetyltransferase domain-containing protein [Cyclobacteriaceae bacterium]
MRRITNIDFTRGLVMVIMALDHVRDMMHTNAISQSPTDLVTTTPILFFTRWITHLCAPTFVFLAGASAYLLVKQKGVQEGRSFLWKRGIWLIVIEFTVINFALWFDIRFRTLIFEVIAAIGFGFVVTSFLSKLSPRTVGVIGGLIVAFHAFVQSIPFSDGSIVQKIVAPFFRPGAFPMGNSFFIVGYSPIPWLGIMLLGFGFGPWFSKSENEMRRRFLWAGLVALGLFVVIRLLNFYGDIPWTTQKDAVFTFLSFNNISKYPPSLLFVLCTVGITFLILSYASTSRKSEPIFLTYGKVPLFYFVLHLYVIHLLTLIMLFLQGFTWSDLNFGAFALGRPTAPSGIELWAIYLVWISVVGLLYWPCKWYANFKTAHKDWWWLKYL